MKAVVTHRYGVPESLEIAEIDLPEIESDSVLVGVRAAGVNPVDWKIVDGHLDSVFDIRFPLVPGFDVAGIVESVGRDVTEFSVGDEIYGYVRTPVVQCGTYAELVVAPAHTLARKPVSLDWAQAAATPLAGLTALKALAEVEAGVGDTVLVHAAAGGVGSFVTQIALAKGARVIGTASEGNHAYLRALGVEPVTYGEGLLERVKELAPDGIDASVDCVGDPAVAVCEQLLKDRTRAASVADPEITRRGGTYILTDPDPTALGELAALADAGRITVHVGRRLPLADAQEAFRLSRSGKIRGKIVLELG